jgi:hypothetical protein
MAENKTQPTTASVIDFLNQVEPEPKRKDVLSLLQIMEEVTGEKAVMWGDSIVGLGQYRYHYASGRQGVWMISGFSPRKAEISLYLMGCMENEFSALLEKLGKFKKGVSCIYVKKLSDLDLNILKELIRESHNFMKTKYPTK